MGISLKDIFKNDEERLIENRRKTSIRNLIIFICVLVVVITITAIIRFWGDVDENRREAITKDITNIRTAVLSIGEQVEIDSTLEYSGTNLEEKGAQLTINGITMEYRYGYYLITPEDLKELPVEPNLNNETYIVNYITGDVINVAGIKYKGRMYHSFEDLDAIAKGQPIISDNTTVISSASDLEKMRQNANGYYKLTANIDMKDYLTSKEGWEPIKTFSGVFDGRGYTISNLTINNTSQDYVGMFGNVKSSAKIGNLKLDNVNITGGEFTGALAGNCSGIISNVHVLSGNVTGFRDSTGGIAGSFSIGSIENCTAKVNVDGDKNVGGIVGTLYNGYISRVKFEGNVTATDNVGGFIGLARISDATQISECATNIAVNGKNNLGGFVGAIEMTASKNLEIKNSYAIGSIQAGETNIGGMFGQIYTIQGTPSFILTYLYSKVSVVPKGETCGGSIGYCSVAGSSQNYTNSFWEKNIAPGTVLNDVGTATEGSTIAFIAKTPEEMKMFRTYTDWDFRSVWEIEERMSTPTLRWEKNYLNTEVNTDEK